jgi:hypothetical protein
MEPRAIGQPHVPADWPPKSESTLNFEEGAEGDDKYRNTYVEPSDSASNFFRYTWR